MSIRDRIAHAWNAFLNQGRTDHINDFDRGVSYGGRPDRTRLTITNERSIISSIYTRLAVDVAQIRIRHARLDDQERFESEVDSGLNECLKVEANLDQSARALRQDIALTMFDRGVAAIVPVETNINPMSSGGYDIKKLRVGHVVQWMPRHVKVSLYNEQTGKREEITLDKTVVAIVENPLYAVMNEPNSTLQRIIRKLNLLDQTDEANSSGKLDMIIQLPYVIKSESRRTQAEQRRKDIEFQLKSSKYGIAYTDGTEKITQLNRSVENKLLDQVEYLMKLLYAQLGLTEEVMNGTADEKAMLNYINRTIEPILDSVVGEMHRKFLTKTARTQRQAIVYFRDPFKLVPIEQLAEIADKFTRNEIASSNEMRQVVGWKPVKDPKADQLRNSNMPQSELGTTPPGSAPEEDVELEQSALDEVNAKIDEVFAELGVEE